MSDHLKSDYILLDVGYLNRLYGVKSIKSIYEHAPKNMQIVLMNDFNDKNLKCVMETDGTLGKHPMAVKILNTIKIRGVLIECKTGQCTITEGLEFAEAIKNLQHCGGFYDPFMIQGKTITIDGTPKTVALIKYDTESG
jgi:hypothetical protein